MISNALYINNNNNKNTSSKAPTFHSQETTNQMPLTPILEISSKLG